MSYVYLRKVAIVIMAAGVSLFTLFALFVGGGSFAFAQTVSTTSTLSAGCVAPTQSLSWGSTDATAGGEVTILQKYLVSNGYLTITDPSAYGIFGRLTEAAVIRFQSANGISPASGLAGPLTRAKIMLLTCGASQSNLQNQALTTTSDEANSSLSVQTDPGNLLPETYYINPSSGAEGAVLGIFDIESLNAASQINNISFNVNSTGTQPSAIYLYKGGTLVSSVVGASVASFQNLQLSLQASSTDVFTVKIDMPANTTPGTQVSFGPAVTVQYNNTEGAAQSTSGNVTGNEMTFSPASSNLTMLSGAIGSEQTNQSGNTVTLPIIFNLKVHPQPGSEVQPVPSNFSVYVGTSNGSGGLYIPVASTTINNINAGGVFLSSGTPIPANTDATFTLTVTLSPLTTPQLVTGTYTAYIESASTVVHDINGNPVPQTYTGSSLVNFYSPPFTVASPVSPELALINPIIFGTSTNATPTILGSASGVNQVVIVLAGPNSGSADKAYNSGLIPVTSDHWLVTVSPALSPGQYTVYVYDANNNLLTSGGYIVVTSSTPPPTTYAPITILNWNQCSPYMSQAVNFTNPLMVACDLNHDSIINSSDFTLYSEGTTNNGQVSGNPTMPISILNWNQCSPYIGQAVTSTNPLMLSCDLNNDGTINAEDFNLWSGSQQSASVIQAVRTLLYQLTGSY